MEREEINRPVPAPRRLYPELRKSEYENVQIDMINKNLMINAENIHNLTNCTEKLPNNKVFLQSDDVAAKCILTETNDLYGPNANENVDIPDVNSNVMPLESAVNASPQPAPRPRKANEKRADDVYENVEIRQLAAPETSAASTGAISKIQNTSPSAIRIVRKAPELPPKTQKDFVRRYRYSASTDLSSTGGCTVNRGAEFERCGEDNMRKSSSNTTLNSSIADSTESTESSKFKSPSPGYVDLSTEESDYEVDEDEPSGPADANHE